MIKKLIDLKYGTIDEKLITFGGKAYPKFGQVVILAGGAGSGKGFVKKKLMGIDGITLDVDRLKELVIASSKYDSLIKDEFGTNVKDLNLKDPKDVSKLHSIVSKLKISNHKMIGLFNSIKSANSKRKPNIIFDVTLKESTKLINIVHDMEELGYTKDNISLVWVVNQFDIASAQNQKRSRTVSPEILLSTHEGASFTLNSLLRKGESINQYLDGDIVVAFNAVNVDSSIVKSDKGGSYVDKADYVVIKEKSKPLSKYRDIEDSVIDKIKRYVPNGFIWDK